MLGEISGLIPLSSVTIKWKYLFSIADIPFLRSWKICASTVDPEHKAIQVERFRSNSTFRVEKWLCCEIRSTKSKGNVLGVFLLPFLYSFSISTVLFPQQESSFSNYFKSLNVLLVSKILTILLTPRIVILIISFCSLILGLNTLQESLRVVQYSLRLTMVVLYKLYVLLGPRI